MVSRDVRATNVRRATSRGKTASRRRVNLALRTASPDKPVRDSAAISRRSLLNRVAVKVNAKARDSVPASAVIVRNKSPGTILKVSVAPNQDNKRVSSQEAGRDSNRPNRRPRPAASLSLIHI